jgi:hypothetical protein
MSWHAKQRKILLQKRRESHLEFEGISIHENFVNAGQQGRARSVIEVDLEPTMPFSSDFSVGYSEGTTRLSTDER